MVNISIKPTDDGRWLLEIREKEQGRRIRLKMNGEYNRAKLVSYCLEFIDVHPEYRDFHKSAEVLTRERLRYALAAELKIKDVSILEDALSVVERVYLKLHEDISVEKKVDVLGMVPIPKKALRVLLVGRFGVGKSTLIKACCNFPAKLDFPVIDTARTTTYSTEYLFKDSSQQSKYGFAVAFFPQSKQRMKLEDAVNRALRKSVQFVLKKIEDPNLDVEDEVMKSFVTDPERLFKSEYLLGKYYHTRHPKRADESKTEQINWWDAFFVRIESLVRLLFEEEDIAVENTEDWSKIEGLEERLLDQPKRSDSESFLQYESIIQDLLETIQAKIETICTAMERDGLGTIIKDSDGSIAGFHVSNYTELNVEQVVTPFTATHISHFGNLLTPLVERIRIEVPYNEAFPKELRQRPLVITDTVGVEHAKNTDTRSIEGSTNYSFEQYDFITVVDDASKSMDSTTANILRSLFSTAAKNKIFLTYTFYDKFDKKDFEDEDDKDYELLSLQDAALRKIAEEVSYDNINWFIDDLKNRTVFLKDLSSITRDYKFVVDYLNKMNEYSIELSDFKRIYRKDRNKPILNYNYKKLALVFSQAQHEYLEQQNKIYLVDYLHYRTAEALTRRLYLGETYFLGINKTLRPVDDFCDSLMQKLYLFLMNPSEENFTHKNEDIINLSEKVKDWLKELVGDKVKELSKKEFVYRYEKHWEKAYMDRGYGSDLRRRRSIMDAFRQILPMLHMELSNNADMWIDELEKTIEQSIQKMEG